MENDGSGSFVNPRIYPSPAGGGAAGATIHDRNNDGAMDISLVDEAVDVIILYNNSLVLGNDEQETDMDLTLYPNPIENTLYITANGYINSVIISNVLGQVLSNSNVDASDTFIDMSGYSSGTYFVTVTVGNNVTTKNIITE